jgi:hypothetical protein
MEYIHRERWRIKMGWDPDEEDRDIDQCALCLLASST